MDSGTRLSGDDGPLWPVAGPPPPPRGRHRRRRVRALLLIAGVTAVAILAVVLALGRKHGPPPPPVLQIRFKEGLTREQMATQITEVHAIAVARRKLDPIMTTKGYLAATRSWVTPTWFETHRTRRPLEGFLFPSTYDFLETTPARTLAARQLTAFHDVWSSLDLGYARSKNLTSYDVLIIASMIEREIAAPDERRLAAAVIYNRLKRHMRLQIDATLVYGFHLSDGRSITASLLRTDNPYNTYTRIGLPPTPIANPGAAAIEAAAHPAPVQYLYYVLKPGTSRHFFTTTYEALKRYCTTHGYRTC